MGSFHGNMLTSGFGASIAASMAAAYGCAWLSSGRISTGVWHVLKSFNDLCREGVPHQPVLALVDASASVGPSDEFEDQSTEIIV